MSTDPDNPYAYHSEEPDPRDEKPVDPGGADGDEADDPYELDDPEGLSAPLPPPDNLGGSPSPGSAAGATLPPMPSGIICPTCGYDLSGTSVGGTCPECGTPVRAAFDQRTAAPAHNGLSITSMILGILSLLGCLCGGFPGLLLGILAVIFGIYGRRETARQGRPPGDDTMALTGLICGSIALGLAAIVILIQILQALF